MMQYQSPSPQLIVLENKSATLCGFAHENTDQAVAQECQVKCLACPHDDTVLVAVVEAEKLGIISASKADQLKMQVRMITEDLLRADISASTFFSNAIEHGQAAELPEELRDVQKQATEELVRIRNILMQRE